MSVFFIADTHFGDGNILRYENRPFATVEEMDQELVRRWNQKVGEKDTVFHLGDVSAHSAEEDRQLLGQLLQDGRRQGQEGLVGVQVDAVAPLHRVVGTQIFDFIV